MKKLTTVLEYQGKRYFGVTKGAETILMEEFMGRFMREGVLLPEDCVHYEVVRKDSILIAGDVFLSDYFRAVVFHVSYSELSAYRGPVDCPPSYFRADHFQVGDELRLDKEIPEGAMYDSITGKLASRNSIRDAINASTERFLEKCRKLRVQVTIAPSPPEPSLFKDYPGGVRILSYHALWNHGI